MENTVAATENREDSSAETIYTAIADKVRADSQNLDRLTHVEELGALFPEMTPEQIINHLAELVKIEQYADVKVTTSASGASYLYSDSFIAAAEANEKVLIDETNPKIARQVQKDSQESVRLTAIESLAELFPELSPDQLKRCVTALVDEQNDQNIKRLVGPTGIAYLYSEAHMTANYANLLARVEAKNPYATIAETVREESRIYPRPTKVVLFYEPVFQIDPALMEAAVEGTLQRDEYKDIKKIIASTGAVYLYSDLYMSPGLAEARVQWEEVDRSNNQ